MRYAPQQTLRSAVWEEASRILTEK